MGKHEGKRPLGRHGHQRYNVKNGSPRNGLVGGGGGGGVGGGGF